MDSSRLLLFERIVRGVRSITEEDHVPPQGKSHPFDERNVHPDLPVEVKRLFDNGHFALASLVAFKYIDEQVQHISSDADYGQSLMMRVFGGTPPKLMLNSNVTTSEQNEQAGYKFIFAGAMTGIRNPRGHKTGIVDDLDTCLDHLSLASMLLRKLERAGLR